MRRTLHTPLDGGSRAALPTRRPCRLVGARAAVDHSQTWRCATGQPFTRACLEVESGGGVASLTRCGGLVDPLPPHQKSVSYLLRCMQPWQLFGRPSPDRCVWVRGFLHGLARALPREHTARTAPPPRRAVAAVRTPRQSALQPCCTLRVDGPHARVAQQVHQGTHSTSHPPPEDRRRLMEERSEPRGRYAEPCACQARRTGTVTPSCRPRL